MELEIIQDKIYEIRGRRVMLDRDLAQLYGVTTSALNQAVKRNVERFPERFMFQPTQDEILLFQNGISSSGSQNEASNLTSQIVISSWGGSRTLPYAFTEQGVAMLASVLRSPAAVQISISIMDAFVAMRRYLTTTATVTAELAEIRAKLEFLERNDEDNLEAINDLSEDVRKDIDNIYLAIGELSVRPPQIEKPRRPIGFNTER